MTDTATLERNATDAAAAAARAGARQGRCGHAQGRGEPDPRPQRAERGASIGPTCSARRCSVMPRCSRPCSLRPTPAGSRSRGLSPFSRLSRGLFIHELTHIKKGAVKGFRFAWNLIVGVPLLVPSFMYEGVHNQHHAKPYYGTVDGSREYLPLALMHPWTLPLFLIAAALAPIGMLIRFASLRRCRCCSRSSARSSSAAIQACRSTRVRAPEAGRRVRARLGVAGSGVQRLGDRASDDGRDRRVALPRLHYFLIFLVHHLPVILAIRN